MSVCPVCLSVTLAYCPQTAGGIKIPLGTEVDLGPGDTVLDGDPAPLPKKGAEPPIFVPCLLWPNSWMDQDDTWHVGEPQSRPHCARWGPSSPKKCAHPQFFAHVYCGQIAGSITIPLGMDVGLSLGAIVLDGEPAPLPYRGTATAPIFGLCPLWPNGWMD